MNSLQAAFEIGRGKKLYGAAGIVVLLGVFSAEYLLFRSYVLGEVSPYYPPHHDQLGYLLITYELYEEILASGPGALLKALFSAHAAQGKLMPIQTSALFLLFGPSRLVALAPNLLYFIALQASVFYLMKKIAGRYAVSFVAVGLILMLNYPFYWYWAGTIVDFRMDFQAFSLYGIFVSAIVAGNAFLSNRWTVMATMLGLMLALLRHVALGYVGGTYLAMLVFLSAVYMLSGPEGARNAARRIRNLVLSGAAILGSTLPFLWASRVRIYEYYGIGHFLGREKDVRSPGETIGTNAIFYIKSLYAQTGPEAAYAAAALLAAAAVFVVYARLKGRRAAIEEATTPFSRENFAFLAAAALVPFLVLIVDLNKSPLVGAVIATPMALFCVMAFSAGAIRAGSRAATAAIVMAAIAAVALGARNQHAHYKKTVSPRERASLEAITEMYLDIGDYFAANSIERPALSFDRTAGYLSPLAVRVVNYEKRGKRIFFESALGKSIFEISREDAFAGARRSDLIVITPSIGGKSIYPFDNSMDALKPELVPMLEKEFIKLKEYRIYDTTYYLFAKLAGRDSRKPPRPYAEAKRLE
jgi:hypothetical protein